MWFQARRVKTLSGEFAGIDTSDGVKIAFEIRLVNIVATDVDAKNGVIMYWTVLFFRPA